MNRLLSLLLLTLALPLTACVPQQQADLNMKRGCEAALNALIQPKEITQIKAARYSYTYPKGEGKHRLVSMDIVEKDGWIELDKTCSCTFLEQWGLFKTSHEALILQVDIDGEVTGKVEGHIRGGFDEFLNLTKTVNRAMGQ